MIIENEYDVKKIEKELSWYMKDEGVINFFLEIINDEDIKFYYSPVIGDLFAHLIIFNNKLNGNFDDRTNSMLEFSRRDISKKINDQPCSDTYKEVNLSNFLLKFKEMHHFI